MRRRLLTVAARIGSMILLAQGVTAGAAEVRVIATPALSASMAELGPQFERATGHTLVIRYALVVAQKQQIDAGEFDLAIVPSFVLDDAIKGGRIDAHTRATVARVSLSVGVRAGAPKPDLTSIDAFKRAMLNARSLSYVTDEPTGRHLAKGFESLGIAESMKAKTRSEETVARVWEAVASGEVELGFGLASNAVAVRGVELAGSLPRELQYYVTMIAGVGTAARQGDAAKALINYLMAPEAAAVMKAKGMEPGAPR